MTIRHIAIIGAGLAGVTNAGTLRKAGFTGRISLINGEAHEPYDRPPLSKNILTQNDAIAPTLQEDSWYEDNKIDRQDDQWVSQITSDGRVILKDDSALKPDRIVLATGSRSRRLAQLDNAKIPAFYIREAGDAYALRKRLKPGQHIGIIGAGFIGLEVAASARSLGLDVTVFEAAPRILTRVLTPATSAFISARHRAEGVTLIEATTVINTSPLGTYGARLTINDDTQIDVDILVVGIGSLANDALAVSAGLKTRNGIEVDDLARTSVPEIYAIGDCAYYPCPWRGKKLRSEQWQHAREHAQFAAYTLLGQETRYSAIPWFWSDQYDMSIQQIGHSQTEKHVECRVEDGHIMFHFDDETLAGATFINQPRLKRKVTKLLELGAAISPVDLANPKLNLMPTLAL